MPRLKRMLVPVDLSQDTEAVLRRAAIIAERHGAAVDVLHVVEDPGWTSSGPSRRDEARTTFFRLLYRGNELGKRLRQHESEAVRRARLIVEVGSRARILRRMMRDRSYQLVIVPHNRWGLLADRAARAPARETAGAPAL